MAKILVVGATSFIGSHLVSELIRRGEQVSIFVRSDLKIPLEWKGVVKIHIGDITKRESIREICKGMDYVFHLAAKVHDFSKDGVGDEDHFKINVEGTRNVLEECCNSKIKQFVYFSSVKTMSEDSKEPLDEMSPTRPFTPYGESKLIAENTILEYGKKFGFSTTSLRLPMVYGPGNKGNIYKMISAIDKGYFFMMGDGQSTRSMVYVGNVVEAALSVIGKDIANGKVYIVTDGMDYTVKQLYATIAQSLGKKSSSFHIPFNLAKQLAKIGDLGSSLLGNWIPFNSKALSRLTSSFIVSSQRIQTEVGFKPKYNLYNTMDTTVQWYKNSH